MKIVRGPYANYIEMPGNRGVTGMVMIETSHIAFHAWDEERPSLVQCDVYSCAEFSISDVLAQLNMMEPVKIDYMVLDRKDELTCKNPEAHVI
jgi:S-adenosylmethionine/arginine decarboxylase-like enzyme